MQELFDLFYHTSGVFTDTRKVKSNGLYIALKGANFNGNTFAQHAIDNGARFAIVDEEKYADNNKIFFCK